MSTLDCLSGKRILLGVTGSIAAYKAADLVRRLQGQGVDVRVAMTRNAMRFVSRLTFEALSGKQVLCDDWEAGELGAIGHIEATAHVDAALLAPATANSIGKLAAGIADDALTSAFMALACPVLIAPAMNERMYRNPVLQRNIRSLGELGVRFVDPGVGSLACGSTGQGRLADVDPILAALASVFSPQDLTGKTVLVTAGPTREFIDAVRFIGNPSSGKMGYALAAAARGRGAHVILITGPTQLSTPAGVQVERVVSARAMHEAVKSHAGKSDIVIMAAAVSDFTPKNPCDGKVKKNEAPLSLELERTADILRELGSVKGKRLLVGFAAETDDMELNAGRKLTEKNLDLIIANDLRKAGSGFAVDTNAVTIMDRSGRKTVIPVMPKEAVAERILDAVSELLVQDNI